MEVEHSFLDYIFGGCEIRLMIAIDLTASNGDPVIPSSLHYCPPGGMSGGSNVTDMQTLNEFAHFFYRIFSCFCSLTDYEKAMRAVGSVVAAYDSDGVFPVVGFGARFVDPSTGREVWQDSFIVSHHGCALTCVYSLCRSYHIV
jgi:hypothetical protein